jgi:hypothetical protein
MQALLRYAWIGLAGFGVACGGSRADAPKASAPAASAPAATTPESRSEPAAGPTADAQPAAATDQASGDATADAPPDAAPAARDPNATRDVRYVSMPEGLKIEVDGVRFMAKAEPVRTPAGFHVRVTVSATASENRSLLASKHGPLAFAGAVKRAGKAEAEQFGDERTGEGDEPLGAGTTVKLSRDWPPKGVRPLGNGDILELDVGLWGLGTGPSDRRAVKQFARVKASVDQWKGKASVSPPPSLIGK